MKRLLPVLMTLVVTMGLGPVSPAQAGPATPVPIKGSAAGTVTWMPPTNWLEWPFVTSTFEDRCSVPSVIFETIELTGNLAHLGAVNIEGSACLQFDFLAGELDFSDAEATFTAANGDQLWAVVTQIDSTEVDGWVEAEILDEFIGGTGRFANASGSMTYTARFPVPFAEDPYAPWTGAISGTYLGQIHYDASDRA
jgi:hypothetical protein